MHAFLITPGQLIAYNLKSATDPDVLNIHPDKSIGIAEIRQVGTFLSRKPLRSKHNTVVIHEAELLTLPAQNAFLKTLEEPPANSLIYLVSENPDNLLPTVLSRIQLLIETGSRRVERDFTSSLRFFLQLQSSGLTEKVALLDAKNWPRSAALEFLEDLEYAAAVQPEILPFLPGIWTTKKYLLANVNVRLCLGELVFSLPSGNNLPQ